MYLDCSRKRKLICSLNVFPDVPEEEPVVRISFTAIDERTLTAIVLPVILVKSAKSNSVIMTCFRSKP